MENQEKKILICGDFCPHDRLGKGGVTKYNPLMEVSKFAQDADLAIVNLECPILTNKVKTTPILKQGPNLYGEEDAIVYLKECGYDVVTLANNHMMDFGDEGLVQTITVLDEIGLKHVGAGSNLESACKTFFIKCLDVTISVINCCEHEFSIASSETPGCNPLDPIKQFYAIKEAKRLSDAVIVIVHGGVEHFQYPTQRMVNTFRFFIDAGADAVINHHQHCVCGCEVYKEKPIYYGLGNFCFDWKGRHDSIWNTGYMVMLSLNKSGIISSKIIPYRQCDAKPTVKCLTGNDLDNFKSMVSDLSNAINNSDILEKKLADFNRENDFLYRKMFSPYTGRIMNGLFYRGLLPSFMNKERILALNDFLICESHYERVKDYLLKEYNNI